MGAGLEEACRKKVIASDKRCLYVITQLLLNNNNNKNPFRGIQPMLWRNSPVDFLFKSELVKAALIRSVMMTYSPVRLILKLHSNSDKLHV